MPSTDGHSVEIANADTFFAKAPWRKSSWSAADGHCVEVARLPGNKIGVRHSKDVDPGRPVLIVTLEEWDSFLRDVISSNFDSS